jgi:hypothetical protein
MYADDMDPVKVRSKVAVGDCLVRRVEVGSIADQRSDNTKESELLKATE